MSPSVEPEEANKAAARQKYSRDNDNEGSNAEPTSLAALRAAVDAARPNKLFATLDELAGLDKRRAALDKPDSTAPIVANLLREAWHGYTGLPTTEVKAAGADATLAAWYSVTAVDGVEYEVLVRVAK